MSKDKVVAKTGRYIIIHDINGKLSYYYYGETFCVKKHHLSVHIKFTVKQVNIHTNLNIGNPVFVFMYREICLGHCKG